jgi:hypothetical protein
MKCLVVELFCVTFAELLFGRRISPDRPRRVWGLFGSHLYKLVHSRSAHVKQQRRMNEEGRTVEIMERGQLTEPKIPKDSQTTWILTLLTRTMHSPERLAVLSLLLPELAGLLGLCRLSSVNREPWPIHQETQKYNRMEGEKQTKANQ